MSGRRRRSAVRGPGTFVVLCIVLACVAVSLVACQDLTPVSSGLPDQTVQSTGVTGGTTEAISTTAPTSADGETAAIQEAVKDELRAILAGGESGDIAVDEVEVHVSLVREAWAAAWFPGPPGYEDGYCVLSRDSGAWQVVFGIEHHWWSSEAELTDALLYAGVPESFALELAGMGW